MDTCSVVIKTYPSLRLHPKHVFIKISSLFFLHSVYFEREKQYIHTRKNIHQIEQQIFRFATRREFLELELKSSICVKVLNSTFYLYCFKDRQDKIIIRGKGEV